MSGITVVGRRDFLSSVFSAGAFVLAARVLPAAALPAGKADRAVFHPSVYLGIDTDGAVTLVSHRSEMGTGIRSVLPAVAADELEADIRRVRVEQAIGDEKYGSQNTDGSCSIRDFYDAFREAGATARLMLERAAAARWNVPASECKASNHFVAHSGGRKLGFGELAGAAARLPVPPKEELTLKPASDFRYIGKELATIDRDDLCTGKGIFGFDAKMPGMLFASIEHPPVLGGRVKSFDDSEARKVKGVSAVVAIDTFKPPHLFQPLGGVAVLAGDTWTAMQARKKLKIEWESNENAAFDSDSYKQSLQDTARKPCKVVRNNGDVDAAFARAKKVQEAEYYVPLLAHASMEPPAAVAEFKDGKVVAYAAVQDPQSVQQSVASALGIDKKDVACNVTLLGGAFGRKSKPDFVVEAALLSKKAGKPVKVVWSREDDLRFDFYHSVAAMYMKAATDEKGRPVAWLQRSVFPTIGSTFDASAEYGQDFEMGMGWTDVPFDIPNFRAENGPAKNHVRIGWMRSVSHIYHAFAIHSFLDELAAAAGRDRVDYYLDLLGPDRTLALAPQTDKKYPIDTGRLRRVIEVVADKSGWARRRNAAIVAHRSFQTCVATVVEVDVDKAGKLRIPRVDIAFDAGQVVNPDRVKAQFEGAAVFGASLALFGEVTARDGRVQQSNFHNYPVARMPESPVETHVHMVNSGAIPTGVGEPGVPPMAPAIANAIFAATGKRIRELPVRKHKLV